MSLWRWRRSPLAVIGASVLLWSAHSASAQDSRSPSVRVGGRVIVAGIFDETPASGAQVVVHRVDTLTSGAALDSTTTGADGSFSFLLRPFGDTAAFYFASASRGGVAYFSQFYHAAELDSADFTVVVFDTTSSDASVVLAGRHIVVLAPSAAGGGARRVVEVFDIENRGYQTRVARAGDAHVWSFPLPEGAYDVGQGPTPTVATSVSISDSVMHVLSPISPGTTKIAVAYSLPQRVFPLSILVDRETEFLEVLVEEENIAVSAAGLNEEAPVAIEDRVYRRLLSDSLPVNSAITIAAPPSSFLSTKLLLLLVVLIVGSGMLIAFALTMRTRPRPAVRTNPVDGSAARLARAIAALDAENERRGESSTEQVSEYTARRARLKKELEAALARARGDS